MSAPVDEFDLDIRLGQATEPGDAPQMFSHGIAGMCLTDASPCSEYKCTTVNRTC